MQRILVAVVVFASAVSLLALAEAKKPTKVAVLKMPAQSQSSGAAPRTKEKPRAKKYLPVADFGDY